MNELNSEPERPSLVDRVKAQILTWKDGTGKAI